MPWPTLLGLIGVCLVLIAYGLLTLNRLRADSNIYQWLNVIGTAGILWSLTAQWNLVAFVTNGLWIAIGVISLVRNARRRA